MAQPIALLVEQDWIDWTWPPATAHLDSVGKDLARLRVHFEAQGVTLERIANLDEVPARLARGNDVTIVCVTQSLLVRARQVLSAQAIQIVAIEALLGEIRSSGDVAPAPP